MKGYPIVRACWFLANIVLAVSIGLVLFSSGWEFSTRSYLKGFSDAIIPSSDSPEQKIDAILVWMQHGPARRSALDPEVLATRNPEDTLNYRQLLEVCGTASNAFLNLAQSSGLRARRLLLLDENQRSKHVVVEILIDSRWIIVDPAYHAVFRLSDGRPATREDLRNPEIFLAATQTLPHYPPFYSYERTAHVRLARIPVIGSFLRRSLNVIWPSWEESINWTLFLERESFAALTMAILLLCIALALRLLLGWYCSRKLGIARVRLRDQLARAGEVLVSDPK